MKKSVCLAICVLGLFTYCAPKQSDVEKIIEDGVEVVLNHFEPYSLGSERALSLEEVLTIDTEKNETVEIGLTDITHIDIDSEGNIFIANRRAKEKCIYKFDESGRFISAFGNKGQGPGEFQNLVLLEVSNQDEIFVSGIQKLLIFSNTGQLKKEIRKETDIQSLIPLDTDRYLGLKMQMNTDLSQSISIVLCSSEITELKTLDSSKIESFTGGTKVNIIPKVVHWAKSNRHVYSANTDKYEIRVFDFNGKLLRRIRREYSAVLVSEKDKEQYKQQIQRYPPNIRDNFLIPKANPPISNIVAYDDKGLFVRTYEESSEGSYVYDMFNSEGAFVGRTELEGFRVKCKGERFYCLKEKENGFKELVVYNMIWN